MNTQLMPYIVMQFFCAILYFININYSINDKYKYIIVGIVYVWFSIHIFYKYKKDMGDNFIELWEKIKENDKKDADHNK